MVNDEDEDDEDEDDEGDEDVGPDDKNHAVSLWCQAIAGKYLINRVADSLESFDSIANLLYAGGESPSYDSADDEDYQPNVEGAGNWRGVSCCFFSYLRN